MTGYWTTSYACFTVGSTHEVFPFGSTFTGCTLTSPRHPPLSQGGLAHTRASSPLAGWGRPQEKAVLCAHPGRPTPSFLDWPKSHREVATHRQQARGKGTVGTHTWQAGTHRSSPESLPLSSGLEGQGRARKAAHKPTPRATVTAEARTKGNQWATQISSWTYHCLLHFLLKIRLLPLDYH